MGFKAALRALVSEDRPSFDLSKASVGSLPGPDLASQAVATRGLAELAQQIAPSTGTLGPGLPIPPQHQDEEEPRRWNYRAGYNVQITPRSGESVSFPTLRALGRNYDICTLARQKRIDGIKSLDWSIKPVPIPGLSRSDARKRAESLGDAIAEATTFWSSPNREDPFDVWVNQYLDDLWTIDAATIYIRSNRAGGVYGLEVPDGATIRPIIDLYGRPPDPPEPAYGQVIFGMTWTMFDREQMIYQPYWQTTDSPYGHPPTEWIIMAINRALRRQTQDLTNYTEGTLPVALLRVAAEASADDLRLLREMLDEMLAGNDIARSRIIPVPGGQGTGLDRIIPEPLNEVEEWLMHVTCAAHGVDPNEIGFVSKGSGLGGKGFAERGSEVSRKREKALADHVAKILTGIEQGRRGNSELMFSFAGLEDTEDSLTQAQATKIYVDMGARSVDNVAEEDLDLDPPGLPPYVMTASGPILVSDVVNPPEPVAPTPPQPVGATGSPDQAPTMELNGPAAGPDGAGPVAKVSEVEELAQWRRKALRSFRAGRSPVVPFVASSISPEHQEMVRVRLAKGSSPEEIVAAFDFAEPLRKAGAPARPLPVSRGNAASVGSGGGSSGGWAPPSSKGSTSGRRPYP